jgi:hypothetical protein
VDRVRETTLNILPVLFGNVCCRLLSEVLSGSDATVPSSAVESSFVGVLGEWFAMFEPWVWYVGRRVPAIACALSSSSWSPRGDPTVAVRC